MKQKDFATGVPVRPQTTKVVNGRKKNGAPKAPKADTSIHAPRFSESGLVLTVVFLLLAILTIWVIVAGNGDSLH